MLVQPLSHDQWRWCDGQASGQGAIEDLTAAVRGRRLLLAVPGEAVSLLTARAPARNRNAWRRALPYALEDQLGEPVESLHFALGATAADGSTPVAVLRAEYLADWLGELRGTGLEVVAATPDNLLLPLHAECWSLLVDYDRVLVRQGTVSGFVADSAALPVLLRQALAEVEAPPERLLVWGEAPITGSPERVVERQTLPDDPLLILQCPPTPPLDLLQGRFQRSAELRRWLRPWRMAAMLAGLLLFAGLAELGLEHRQLLREQTQLRDSMEQLYRQTVPGAQRVINPRAQLAGRLQALERTGGGSGFLDLLAASGDVLREFPELQLQAMRYRDGRLELDLEGGRMETLDRLQDRLRSTTRLQVQVRASMREDRVVSRLSVAAS